MSRHRPSYNRKDVQRTYAVFIGADINRQHPEQLLGPSASRGSSSAWQDLGKVPLRVDSHKMKITSLFVLSAFLAIVPCAKALVGTFYSVTNVPDTGLTDITFPLTIVEADHFAGYYFAQDFTFINSGRGYTGLQPRPDAEDGTPILHGVFSSFIDGTTTTDANCVTGADNGPGVSCSAEWNGVYGRTYNLEVKRNGSSLWVGTAIDTVTRQRMHIGSWTLPASAEGIQGGEEGFVEWYPWNSYQPPNHCALLPYQNTSSGPRARRIRVLSVPRNWCLNMANVRAKWRSSPGK
ncbi:hypothetical protein DFH06DRAFT_1338868 [Mycena polygramma]|nr:hypothetical protein DFH06DRAFT_1338868 [Mycena polygramma]